MDKNIFVALDCASEKEALDMINTLKDTSAAFKVGMELFYNTRGSILEYLKDRVVFLDLKLHDIPNTVLKSAKSILEQYSPDFLSVHIDNGEETLRRLHELTNEHPHTKIVGISVLTSLDEKELAKIYGNNLPSVAQITLNKANLASKYIGAFVCSVHEAKLIKTNFPNLYTICPGIRLQNDDVNDQKRVATPLFAKENLADSIVVGRSITKSSDPKKTFDEIKKMFIGD